MSLAYIAQQMTIYVGLLFVVAGLVGNGINVLVFLSVCSYRRTPCTFYFLTRSIANIVYTAICLTSRIAMSGYGIDLTRTSTSWCKMRQFIGVSFILISMSCTCLATIDQFFVTSQSVNLPRFSNIKWAQRIVLVITIVWLLHAVPILVIYEISPVTNLCGSMNYVYTIYYPVILLGFYCVIPGLVLIIFGYLAYRNIHLTRVLATLQADRQLIRMTLVEVILVLISFIPFGFNNAYSLITSGVSKNTNRLSIESFATTIAILVTYSYFAGNCYMFLISSSRFRRATKKRIFYCLLPNQVNPVPLHIAGMKIKEQKLY